MTKAKTQCFNPMKSERSCCGDLYALNHYSTTFLTKIASINLLLGERHYQKEQKDANDLSKRRAPQGLCRKIEIMKPEGGGNESQTVRTDGILPLTNTQNSLAGLAPYFLFSTVTNASKHLKKRNTPHKQKGRLPRQNREYVDTCSCTWKRKPPEAIRDPKQRPQHTEPTLTHHKDPNTPQHNDVCLKASLQNMQTTTGQQRPDPTLTHTRKIPNTHHDVCLAEIHRACTHPTMNQTAQTRNTPQHNVCFEASSLSLQTTKGQQNHKHSHQPPA